ncbi:MAG: DMT family transporter [Clostridia bacterium]|nr:DMT family transporter [Clostridia bacterium]
MSKNRIIAGHLAALMTMMIWGMTFVSTKVLLRSFTPVEILVFRFMIGLFALILLNPRPLKLQCRSHEWYFVGIGLTGITLYFLLENIALTYTYASNVGVITSLTPFFVAICSHFLLKDEKLTRRFLLGFLIAMVGILLIHINGTHALKLNPKGDLLAILAGVVWGLYSVLIRKLSQFHYNTLQVTRRGFVYGLLFMLPAVLLMDFQWDLGRLARPQNLFNLLFLGLGASALCFASWNWAIKVLGVIRSSVYIYLGPVVAVIASALILSERITPLAILGTALTLSGLLISEFKNFSRAKAAKSKIPPPSA